MAIARRGWWIAAGLLTGIAILAASGAWWVTRSEGGLEWVIAELQRRTDGALRIEGARGRLAGPLKIERIRYDDDSVSVTAESVELHWTPWALRDNVLDIRQLSAASLRIALKPSNEPATLPATLDPKLTIHVLRAEVASVELTSPEAFRLQNVRLAYEGSAERHEVRTLDAQSEWGRLTGNVRIGSAAPFPLQADVSLQGDEIRSTATAAGTLTALAIELKGVARGAQGDISAKLAPFGDAWLSSFRAHLDAVNLAAFEPSLPVTRMTLAVSGRGLKGDRIEGTLDARNALPGAVTARRLPLSTVQSSFVVQRNELRLTNLRAALGAAGRVTGSARLGQERGQLDLALTALNLRGLHPPLHETRLGGSVQLVYEPGTQRVTARLADRNLRFDGEAIRKGDGISVPTFRLAAAKGELSGHASLALDGTRPFSVTGRFARFDPAALGDYPPAVLNGDLRVSGNAVAAWSANVDLAFVNSSLRNAPLNGTARLHLTPGAAREVAINLRAGENVLEASGNAGRPQDALTISLNAPRLDQLDPRAAGAMVLNGKLEGALRNPTFSADASADRLQWKERALAERLVLRLGGTLGNHRLTASGRALGGPFTAEAQGSLDSESLWRGSLRALELSGNYPFRLMAPTTLTIGPQRFSIGAAEAQFAAGTLSIDAVHWENDQLNSRGRFARLPAGPLLRLGGVAAHPKTSLQLSGRWDLRGAPPALDGTVEIARESGDLVFGTDTPVALGLQQLTASARFRQGAVEARADAAGAGGTARLTMTAGGLTPEAPVALQAHAELPTLRPFDDLIGTAAALDGRLRVDLAVGGTLGKPVVTGTATGDGMRVDAPPYGISLREGTLRAVLTESALELQRFSARGDSGDFTASGTMARQGDGGARLAWRATQLMLFNRPDRRLKVDGAGTLAIRKGRLALQGNLKAEQGYFEFDRSGAAELAPDIVIKGRPRAAPRGPFKAALLDLDIELDFGNQLHILGSGLDADLRGKLRVRTMPDGTLAGFGTVRTERGSYYAFGQKLTLDRGRLIFDGPLDNPALDIRAMRKNLQVEAGVEVTGTVKVPQLQLVSNPPVPDGEKLTWLMLGSGPEGMSNADFAVVQAAAAAVTAGGSSLPLGKQMAQRVGLDDIAVRGSGVAGTQVVAVGKRLSDKVYVEYEQGLVTTNNILRLSYVLTRTLSLSAETGRSSGAGIIYRKNFD